MQRVEVGPDLVAVHLVTAGPLEWLESGLPDALQPGSALVLTVAVKLRRRGSELKLVLADRRPPINRDRCLISALARGFR